jgi:hypothetical protein
MARRLLGYFATDHLQLIILSHQMFDMGNGNLILISSPSKNLDLLDEHSLEFSNNCIPMKTGASRISLAPRAEMSVASQQCLSVPTVLC